MQAVVTPSPGVPWSANRQSTCERQRSMATYKEAKTERKKFRLSPDEQAFVDAYAENGGDALQAYEATKPNPNLSHKAKAHLATMMLRRDKVKRAIAPLHDAAARAVSATLERYAV